MEHGANFMNMLIMTRQVLHVYETNNVFLEADKPYVKISIWSPFNKSTSANSLYVIVPNLFLLYFRFSQQFHICLVIIFTVSN